MAIACPVDLNTQLLRSEVSKVYSRVATDPDGDFHFHRGPAYATDFLGYDAAELAALPRECTASFAGIANPHMIAPIVRYRLKALFFGDMNYLAVLKPQSEVTPKTVLR